ncbi:hypothetical protein [Saliphagus sp. LR7]|uniref:hypothetical protein n=1 Tax=Saliphagus sp. LR7 TaxID=2282654 RepID=UPI000DF7FD04|nr:hypothetical protein [Saliphagus sp. LR7]
MSVDTDGADVPDEWEDWPFDARAYVLAEANNAIDLRREIEDIVGMEPIEEADNGKAGQFTKAQLAMILMALGGPGGEGA